MAESETHAGQVEFLGSLPKGTRLRNYELVSVLGHGAFGITYQARDTTLGRTVAIKEYLPTMLALRDGQSVVIPRSTELAEDFTWGRDRFLEEARILVTLDGVPSVVRVHDFLEANGTAYMVMALVRGETLERRLKRDRSLPAPVVEKLLYRLLDGLEQVHAAGFLHRDIKPANIILDADDNPTLIDFGASRASMADRTSAMTAIFTPRYAAAEQLGSGHQGPWTDIYGLAVTLHCAVAGRAPPTAMERLASDGYEPLSEARPAGFAPPLLRGIDAGLALKAADRPQTIADWREVFASAAHRSDHRTGHQSDRRPDDATVVRARKPPSAPPSSPPSSPAPAARQSSMPQPVAGRRRGLALTVGGVAAAALLAVGGYFLMGPPSGALPSGGASASENSQGVAVAATDTQAERQKAEEAARQQAAVEAAAKAQAERQKAEEAARQQAAAEAAAKAQAERQKAEEAARQQAAAEAAAKAQAERQKAEEAARQQAAAEAAAKAQAERQKAEEAARQQAAAEAAAKAQAERQKAEEAARQQAAAEAAAKAQAERQKAEEAARQQAAAEAAAKAQAERQKAEEAAREKAAAEAAAKAQAERQEAERQKAEQQKAEEAARQKAAAEEAARVQAEQQQKADAAAQQQRNAEAGEAALGLTAADRQRLQLALTSLGFDTRGNDGVFGPRSREMIAAWQKQRGLPESGYLSDEQRATLLREGGSAVTKGLAEPADQTKKVTVKQPAAGPPALSYDQRCRTILQKAQLTGALGDDDRAYLKERCR